MQKSVQTNATGPVSAEMIEREYGKATLDLILVVMVNFHYSEIEIMDLCGKWIPRRTNLIEKGYLVKHANDELRHAKLFRQGVERLVTRQELDYVVHGRLTSPRSSHRQFCDGSAGIRAIRTPR